VNYCWAFFKHQRNLSDHQGAHRFSSLAILTGDDNVRPVVVHIIFRTTILMALLAAVFSDMIFPRSSLGTLWRFLMRFDWLANCRRGLLRSSPLFRGKMGGVGGD
jgi:hypothetical protein